MKRTYITTVPDHIGAFLKASRIFSELGMNITRTSYNKAVDSNTIFLDAEGSEEQHEKAGKLLNEIGYLQEVPDTSVVLLEFLLRDRPGVVVGILELINDFHFNISYISSQENGTEYQPFKMGLYVEDHKKIEAFITAASGLCKVRVIDYNHTERIYDNSLFYNSFVNELTREMELPESARQQLLVSANLAMQVLDESGLSPYKTFDHISRFAHYLAVSRKDAFQPRITTEKVSEETELILIEPPCGSNTAILHHGEEYLFVDSGYACYREEMLALFRKLIPGFETVRKRVLITHADVDHCGLLNVFDEVIANERSAECLRLEAEGKDGFREQNPLHKPYIDICKTLTSYAPVDVKKIRVQWPSPERVEAPLTQIGFFSFGDLHFEVYEGGGGHLPGEIVLIDYANQIAFTGDVYVNLKAMTPEQAAYNRSAPVLMTSVDTDPKLCAAERKAVFARLGSGEWKVFGAHGGKLNYTMKQEK